MTLKHSVSPSLAPAMAWSGAATSPTVATNRASPTSVSRTFFSLSNLSTPSPP